MQTLVGSTVRHDHAQTCNTVRFVHVLLVFILSNANDVCFTLYLHLQNNNEVVP